jgi:sodium-coupled neutral amino acid transporter 11
LKNDNFNAIVIASKSKQQDQTLIPPGDASILSSSFNLAKLILGAGILSLPSGIAAFSDDPKTSLGFSTVLLLFMGMISAYSFSSIGKACDIHKTKSFADAWSKSVGPKTSRIISFMITFKTFFACLAYSIIIGDSFSSLAKSLNFSDLFTKRSNVIIGITSTVVLPLCLLKNLDALKYTSMLGLSGIVYCAIFLAIRFIDGSYSPGGLYFKSIAESLRPSFGKFGTKLNSSIFILISMMSTAFVAHYNAPKFWVSLKDRSTSRYNTVVTAAFSFSALMYVAVMWIGFLTFGGNSTGFILNNFAKEDKLATIARLAIGAGILCSYPLTFTGLRDGVFDLCKIPENKKDSSLIPVTVGILSVITGFALVLKNLGLVVAVSGALIGATLIYLVPAIMNINNIKAASGSKAELLLNYFMAGMGIMIAVLGGYTSVMGAGH